MSPCPQISWGWHWGRDNPIYHCANPKLCHLVPRSIGGGGHLSLCHPQLCHLVPKPFERHRGDMGGGSHDTQPPLNSMPPPPVSPNLWGEGAPALRTPPPLPPCVSPPVSPLPQPFTEVPPLPQPPQGWGPTSPPGCCHPPIIFFHLGGGGARVFLGGAARLTELPEVPGDDERHRTPTSHHRHHPTHRVLPPKIATNPSPSQYFFCFFFTWGCWVF